MIKSMAVFADPAGANDLAECINMTLCGVQMEPHKEGGVIVVMRFTDTTVKQWVKAGEQAGRQKGFAEGLVQGRGEVFSNLMKHS